MSKLKVVYKIRQGLFSNGNDIFINIPENYIAKELNQAPLGHSARYHNSRLPKSSTSKISCDMILTYTQGSILHK